MLLMICEDCGWQGESDGQEVECPKCGSFAVFFEDEVNENIDVDEVLRGDIGDWDI
jgi:hypothetical protein